MELSFKYILQASRVLDEQIYTEKDLKDIFLFLIDIDNYELNEYILNRTVVTYEHDLEVYMLILEKVLKIYENQENYEYCHILKMKLDECNEIINNNKKQ